MPEPLVHCVRVLFRVDVSVMRAMRPAPPPHRALERSRSPQCQHSLHDCVGSIRFVGPQPVVSGSDAQPGEPVLNPSEKEGLPVQRNEREPDQKAEQRPEDNPKAQPVDPLQQRQLRKVLVGHVRRLLGLLVHDAFACIILRVGGGFPRDYTHPCKIRGRVVSKCVDVVFGWRGT
eukprot:2135472-Rhodomonas_salina.1